MSLALPLFAAFAVMATPWPKPLATPAAFDEASRGEILQAWKALAAFPAAPWRDQAQAQLRANFAAASAGCAGLFCEAKTVDASASVPAPLAAWAASSLAFHKAYWAEQERLAKVFAKVTSEVAAVDPGESLGNGYPDKTFLLTFDDGPGKYTQATAAALAAAHANGLFFVLGTAYAADKAPLYAGNCVGWHGDAHTPHTTAERARSSAAAGKSFQFSTFRPPYGQRSKDVVAAFQQQGFKLVLWNLDSQDWSKEMSAEAVENRVLTLMLTRRHGIALFHDIHPKAELALPRLFSRLAGAGLTFADCHQEIPPG